MNFLIKVLVIFLIVANAYAGFGRAGSSGSRSSYSSSSSASYVSPSRYSYSSAPAQRTVIREYHTNTVHTSSGGDGVHPLVAGMVGYMVGNASANHTQYAPSPQVVYVNGQPQQAQQGTTMQDQSQMAQAPIVQSTSSESHGFFFYASLILLFLFGISFVGHSLSREGK